MTFEIRIFELNLLKLRGFQLLSIVLIIFSNADEKLKILNDDNGTVLKKCLHIDPYVDIISWSTVNPNISNCDPLTPKEKDEIINEAERKRYEWGVEKFAYDLLASDKIGPHRKLSPVYHKLCESLSRNISLD
ncbi:putative N-acetylgalactosaminyltransferase [Dirofilaria immitis]